MMFGAVDAKVADIINDDSLFAQVSITGTLNGKVFIIAHTKTSSKAEGNDLTYFAGRETNKTDNRQKACVGSQILARTMFSRSAFH